MRGVVRLGALLLWTGLAVAGCATQGACGNRECPDEAEITKRVETLFAEHPELQPPNLIYIRTRGHQVTLSGQVAGEYDRRLAESTARSAQGVEKVVNLIGVISVSR